MRKLVVPALAAVLLTVLALSGTVRGQQQPPPPPPPNGGTALPCPFCTPPPPPGGGPSATPTSTATPTPTATPVPLTIRLRLAHGSVKPQSRQTLTITALAGAGVSVVVTFPNGDRKYHDVTAGTSGVVHWSYVQPGSRITHGNQTAKVTAEASIGDQDKISTKRYHIGFAGVDVSVQPRVQKRGKQLGIWVHSRPHASLSVLLRFRDGRTASMRGSNRSNAWWYAGYRIPGNAAGGRVGLTAFAVFHRPNHTYTGKTSFQVK